MHLNLKRRANDMTITKNAPEYQKLFKKLLQAIEKGPGESLQECLG